MLGLGSNMMKHPVTGKSIVRDGLVLQHNYNLSSVEPLSSGAADINADAANNEYIAISGKPIDTADGTYCWWSNSTQTAYQTIFSHGSNSTGAFHAVMSSTNKPLLYLHSNRYQYWADTGFADDGKWHHWAIVVDVDDMQNGCKLYIDGVLIAQDSGRIDTGTPNSYGDMVIGKEGSNEYRGYMCNFGVWSSHLSQAQIKSIMNKNYAGLSDSEKTDLVSWWNLDSVIPDTTSIYDNHYGGGETLGTDKVTDGTFINGLASWSNSGVTESGGVVTFDADASTDYIFQNLSYTDDKVYAITLEGTGNAKIRVGYSGLAATQTVVGTLPATLNLFVDSTANRIQIYKNSGDEMLLTSVSVKEINGNTGTLS